MPQVTCRYAHTLLLWASVCGRLARLGRVASAAAFVYAIVSVPVDDAKWVTKCNKDNNNTARDFPLCWFAVILPSRTYEQIVAFPFFICVCKFFNSTLFAQPVALHVRPIVFLAYFYYYYARIRFVVAVFVVRFAFSFCHFFFANNFLFMLF